MDSYCFQEKYAGQQKRVNTLQNHRPLPSQQVSPMDNRRPDRGMLRGPERDGGHPQRGVGAHRAGRPPDYALRQTRLLRAHRGLRQDILPLCRPRLLHQRHATHRGRLRPTEPCIGIARSRGNICRPQSDTHPSERPPSRNLAA